MLTCGEIRDIRQYIQYRNNEDRNEAIGAEPFYRILCLIDHVEGVLEAGVREDDLVQGICETVGCGTGAFERVVEVGRVRFGMPAEHDEAGYGDED